MHWPRRFFQRFKRCTHVLHFLMNAGASVPCPMHLWCCLNHENTSTSKFACFAPRSSFASLKKTITSASTTFPFPTTAITVHAESASYYVISARFSFECRSAAAKLSKFLVYQQWLSLLPSHGTERYKEASPPEYPKQTVQFEWCCQEEETRVERRSSADWPHARAVVANCFCNFPRI